MQPIQRILCPVDFSECSRAALGSALGLQRRLGAHLEVLHAYQIPESIQPSLLAWMPTGPRPVWELAAEQAETDTQAFLESMGLILGTFDYSVVRGDAVSVIVRRAREHAHDLIVMGTHGRSAALHLFKGSVAENVVRSAPCPVLTIHAKARASTEAVRANVLQMAIEMAVKRPDYA